MLLSPQERRLIFISILSRCVIILLAAVVSNWIEPFDTSSYVAYNNYPTTQYKSNFDRYLRRSLVGFGNWDGIYFLRISTSDYEFDQYYAFFPLLPILTASLRSYLLEPLLSPWLAQHTLTLLSSVLVSNSCFVIATVFLYKLSLQVLGNVSHAYWSAVLFCINPASVFMSAAYTESLFAAIAFGTFWAQSRAGPLATIPFLVLASLTRSNGAPLIAVIGHSALLKQLQSRPYTLFSVISACIVAGLLTVPAALSAWLPLFGFEQRARSIFCDGSRPPELVPWCSDKPTGAALYGFIQKNYWNIGLFNYWEMKQLPNFLIATPMIILSIIAVIKYFKHGQNLKNTFTLNTARSVIAQRMDSYYNPAVSSYILHWLFLLVFGILFMYIQVLNRFLSSQCAPLYWFVAHTLMQTPRATLMPKLIVAYFILYYCIGTILFISFYPWT